jgi:lipase chaperone LimK
MKSGASNIKQTTKKNKDVLSENSAFGIEQAKDDLTIEKLRAYDGFEDVDEEEAKEHIKLIKTFARVLFDIYQQENKK